MESPTPFSLSAHSPLLFSRSSLWGFGHPPPPRKPYAMSGNTDDLDEDVNVDGDVGECNTDENDVDVGDDGDDKEDVNDATDDDGYADEDADVDANAVT